jgi:alginate O-acetyltransferase complex protein AlgI
MLFNSAIFLFVFFPVTYVVYWTLRRRNLRYLWLTITGYVFYGYWRPSFCLLIALSTAVSYLAGLGFLRWQSRPIRRFLLIAPIVLDLSLLAFFKYADFLLRSVNAVFLSGRQPLPLLNIILPVGISFYTFHTISYIIDSYRGTIRPTRNLLEFATYVSLFSQLVAGPIIRFRELQDDLESLESKSRTQYADAGWSLFAIGMIQKVCLADPIASYIDPAFAHPAQLSTSAAWICALGYSYQLLLDFSGYSNMAIGLGLLFGMRIPSNFDRPYQALNPSDFWRRWHMSLSRFLRDYVYVGLGGNRGSQWRARMNLLLTMLLGGLWHGASWTFVAWGGFHGLLLIAHRDGRSWWERLPVVLQQLVTFLLVLLGWVLFRSATFTDAATIYSRMIVPAAGLKVATPALLLFLFIAGAVTHFGPTAETVVNAGLRGWRVVVLAGIFLVAVLRVLGSSGSPFLYFQF